MTTKVRIFRRSYTKPIPDKATISRRRGRGGGKMATWSKMRADGTCEVYTAPLTKDGSRIMCWSRHWFLSFEDARKITDPKTAAYRIRYYFFLPEDYEEKRRQDWTETTGRRVTENPMEAEAEVWEDQAGAVPLTETPSEKNAFRGWPLYQRLRGMMELRGLRQKDLASIFQVTPPIITRWLKGTEAPQSGDGLGSPIPEDLAPLVLRWVETEKTPSAEDMASIMARRQKKKGGGGRPTGRN